MCGRSHPAVHRYFSEADFVQKYRVTCLLPPLLALLSDNASVYQGRRRGHSRVPLSPIISGRYSGKALPTVLAAE